MKKIELKPRKYWDIYCKDIHDLLTVGAILQAAGYKWECVETTLSGGESVCQTLRVYSGKKKAKEMQRFLRGVSGMILNGPMSIEVYPHR